MAVVKRFNVNKEQATLDADIIENMSANDVSYDDSTQYDENTVGDKLSELEKDFRENIKTLLDESLYISDNFGNVIGKFSKEGLTITDIKFLKNVEIVSLLTELRDKVDKENGKGLSTEDFTTVFKDYLEELSSSYQKCEDTFYVTDVQQNVIAKVDKDGIHSVGFNTSTTSFIDKENYRDSNKLLITDNNMNIIAEVSSEGVHSVRFKASSFVDENDKPMGGGSEDIYPNYKSSLYIIDTQGNIIGIFSKDGFETTTIKADSFIKRNESPICDSRYSDWELFSIGDSLCRTGQWQPITSKILGCSFDQGKNQKPGFNLSTGGTTTFGVSFDSTPWRVKNLIDEGYIVGSGNKTLVVFENVNDGVQSFNNKEQAFNLTEPIEGYLYNDFTSTLLATIPTSQRTLDKCFRLLKTALGTNLTITKLPIKEGDVCINVGWSGPGVHPYYIHVVPKSTDSETRQDIIEKILEYNYSGVTGTLADDGQSVDFASGSDAEHRAQVYFTDTDNTGMEVLITDTSAAKSSVAKFFIGDTQKVLTFSGDSLSSGSIKVAVTWGLRETAIVKTIQVVKQSTDLDTIKYLVDSICSESFDGVTLTKRTDGMSIIFQKIETSHSTLRVSISNSTINGLTFTITDGELSSDIWENTSYWKDGMTFSEGWKTSIEMLQRNYPDCHIVVASFPAISITPNDYRLPNGTYDTVRYYEYLESGMNKRLQQYKDITNYFSVPFIDIHNNCGISISNLIQYYPVSANVHPKQEGYERWGETAAALIKSLI